MFLLGAVAVYTWINVNQPKNLTDEDGRAGTPSMPGYYLNEAVITVGGADGTPLYQLQAQQIVHQPSDESILLSDVRFDYLEQRDSPWELVAEHGRISDDQQVVELFGQVRLVNTTEDSDTPTTVITDSLDILPDSYVATTESEVIVTHGQFQITALGMAADLNQGQVQLKSKIHGTFRP